MTITQNFSSARYFFGRRNIFAKNRAGRCDRFRAIISNIEPILAIFLFFLFSIRERFAWNTGNMPRGTQWIVCMERKECLVWNTGKVLLGTQGASCLDARNVLLETQYMWWWCQVNSFMPYRFRYHSYNVTNVTSPYFGTLRTSYRLCVFPPSYTGRRLRPLV